MNDEDKTQNKGYVAGLMGQPSRPPMHSENLRNKYERAYDMGRRARLSEHD